MIASLTIQLVHAWCLQGAPLHFDPRSEFLAMLDRETPRTGRVEVVAVPAEGVGETRAGFDFETGAWFVTGGVLTRGREASGREYVSGAWAPPAGKTAAKPIEADPVGPLTVVASYIPTVWLWILQKNPGIVTDVHEADSGYVVMADFPDSNAPIARIEIGKDGRIRQASRQEPTKGGEQGVPYSYRSDVEGRIPIPTTLQSGHKVVSYRVGDSLVADAFTQERVETVASQVRFNDEKELASRREASRDGAKPEVKEARSALPPLAPTLGERMRLPLLISGIVVVGIGIGLLVRRRFR